jgi:hypothetical protein
MRTKQRNEIPFFITYANNPIAEPLNIPIIFESLQNNLPMNPPALKTLFQEMESFLNVTQEEAIRILNDKIKVTKENLPQPFVDLLCTANAYYACYGYAEEEIGCGLTCERWEERIKKAGRKMTLRTTHRVIKGLSVESGLGWKCIECQQRYFIFLLGEIVSGKNYEEIGGFDDFINTANKLNCWAYRVKGDEIILEPTWGVEDDSLIPLSIEASTWPVFDKKNLNRFAFQNQMDMILAYDLIRFLKKPGRGKLGKCKQCKNFYPCNKTDKRNLFCSDECRYAFNRGRKDKKAYAEYVRNLRANKRRKKKEREERKIKQLMEKGYTREEAIDEIKGKV